MCACTRVFTCATVACQRWQHNALQKAWLACSCCHSNWAIWLCLLFIWGFFFFFFTHSNQGRKKTKTKQNSCLFPPFLLVVFSLPLQTSACSAVHFHFVENLIEMWGWEKTGNTGRSSLWHIVHITLMCYIMQRTVQQPPTHFLQSRWLLLLCRVHCIYHNVWLIST